jgi:hypothetical protein
MKIHRRLMMSSLLGAGVGLRGQQRMPAARLQERYARLDSILKQPVLKKQLFSSAEIIDSIELLRFNNSFLCRVRSRSGAEGMSVAHAEMRNLYPIFLRRIQPFLIGKDARELDLILEPVLSKLAPWCCLTS